MADSEGKEISKENTEENRSEKQVNQVNGSEKRESLEDLLTTLSHQIKNSDWLQLNTAEKFAAENPEVAEAFRDAALKDSQKGAS